MDETDYTSGLKGAIDNYLLYIEESNGRTHTRGSRAQSVKNWEKNRPFDLIAALKNGNLIILEVKLQENEKFTSPYPKQFDLNLELEKLNHPIRYCYNTTPDYAKVEDLLTTSQQSVPSNLFIENPAVLNKKSHESLKKLIDDIASGGTTSGDMLKALIVAGTIATVDNLTTTSILIIYNNEEGWLVEKLSDVIEALDLKKVKIDSSILSIKDRVKDLILKAEKQARAVRASNEVSKDTKKNAPDKINNKIGPGKKMK